MVPCSCNSNREQDADERIEYLLSSSLDPKVWGNLPPDVLLKIYNALLIYDFYKLRVVCKEWNNVACERRCFSDPIPKPYFVLIAPVGDLGSCWIAPSGTLAYSVSSGRWIWRVISLDNYSWRSIGDHYEPFVVEGVFCEGVHDSEASFEGPPDFSVGVPQSLLFDVHVDRDYSDFKTVRRGRETPEAPGAEGLVTSYYRAPPIARSIMMVDTSTRPSTYKLIMGNCNVDTFILDSQTNTWESKPSRMVRCRAPRKSSCPKSVVQCNGRMYIWSESDEIQVYSLEEYKWSALNPPPRHESDGEFRGLAHWQSELYAVTKNEQGTLSVWKLIDPPTQQWSEFERIPSDMFSHLVQPGAIPPVVTSHCNEFLLMHVLMGSVHVTKRRGREKLGRRYVLLNISNRRWEIVTLPNAQLWKERSRN